MDKLLVVVGRHAFRKAAGWLAGCRSSCTFRAYELWALEWEGINQNLLQSSFSSHHITHRHPQFRRIKLYNDPEGTQCYTFNLQSTHSRCQRNGAEVHGYGERKIRRRRDLKKNNFKLKALFSFNKYSHDHNTKTLTMLCQHIHPHCDYKAESDWHTNQNGTCKICPNGNFILGCSSGTNLAAIQFFSFFCCCSYKNKFVCLFKTKNISQFVWCCCVFIRNSNEPFLG